MPRPLSPRAIVEAQRVNSQEVFLVLFTIGMGGTAPDVRIVNNTEDLMSRGQNFIGIPVRITLPEDPEEFITSNASVEIDNVDPNIWQGLRALTFSPSIMIEIVLASEPDTVILATSGLRLREATATTAVVSATLVPESIWQVGYPEGDFDPPQFPGLFT